MSLTSQERSVKRGLFEQAMREKERLQDEEKARQEQERIRYEEAEIKRIRAQSNFKATPIRKYSNKLGNVSEKKLTVPKSPRLQTQERAVFKDESASAGRSEQ